jgi:flagellar basal-body rod modification protein FlgD
MTTIAATTTTTTNTSETQQSRNTLSDNFDTFLTLLTTQLQNQDPLDPVDSEKFTEQLVQYSQVEQQIGTNEKLDTLIESIGSNNAVGSLSYLGRTATFYSSTTALADGEAKWTYTLGDESQTTTLKIKDSDGDVVFTTTGQRGADSHDFVWDGKMANGQAAPEGLYTLEVTATATNGDTIQTAVTVSERITGVNLADSEPTVTTRAGVRTLDSVITVKES